jgi:hypothetical protein
MAQSLLDMTKFINGKDFLSATPEARLEMLMSLASSAVVEDKTSDITPLDAAKSNVSLLSGAATSAGNAATYAQDKNYAGASISGAAAGAGIGTMIAPGVGTAIGAGVGALAGALGTALSKKPEAPKDPLEEERKRLANEYQQKVNAEMTRKMNRQTNIRNLLLYR